MLQGQHVLVIEDEPLIALDLEQALISAGAAVGIAHTAASATRAAHSPAFTAAIVDLRLHGQSVREAVERLSARDLPFLFYSGHTETPTAASWPSVPFLMKPLPPAEVVGMLTRIVLAKVARIADQDKRQEPA